jgi:hypothetical protein
MPKQNENFLGEYVPEKKMSINTQSGETFDKLGDGSEILVKGPLIKKNWYGNKQLRHFELHSNGELKYYADKRDFKGAIQIGANSKIRKTAKTTVTLTCESKKKEYVLMQPDNSQINFAKEKQQGHIWMIDDWIKELQAIADNVKKHNQYLSVKSLAPV